MSEIEATAVHAPGADLAPYASPGVIEEYRPRIIMAPEEAAALDKSLRDMMQAVLRKDVDYGVIPGTGSKPTLFKPGAEKLLQWFGFGHSTEKVETERDGDGSRLGVTYKCTVTKAMPDGRTVTVATCEGYAGYDEDRFYASAEQARAKAEASERKWARADGRPPRPEKWEGATGYRAPWNSVIKMAQKRALVGAALQATSASTLFTQDLEDMPGAPGDGGFAAARDAAIMALPEDVRNGLDRWYQGKKWPGPGRWTVEQSCAALQMAGYLTARREKPRQAAQPEGPREGAAPAPAPEAPAEAGSEAAWVKAFSARLAAVSDERGLEARAFEVNKALGQEVIAPAVASGLHAAVAARRRELRDEQPAQAAAPAEGAVQDQSPATGGDAEAEFVREFLADVAGAGDDTAVRNLRVRMAKAVAAKTITPETGNDLGEALKARAGEIREKAA